MISAKELRYALQHCRYKGRSLVLEIMEIQQRAETAEKALQDLTARAFGTCPACDNDRTRRAFCKRCSGVGVLPMRLVRAEERKTE